MHWVFCMDHMKVDGIPLGWDGTSSAWKVGCRRSKEFVMGFSTVWREVKWMWSGCVIGFFDFFRVFFGVWYLGPLIQMGWLDKMGLGWWHILKTTGHSGKIVEWMGWSDVVFGWYVFICVVFVQDDEFSWRGMIRIHLPGQPWWMRCMDPIGSNWLRMMNPFSYREWCSHDIWNPTAWNDQGPH